MDLSASRHVSPNRCELVEVERLYLSREKVNNTLPIHRERRM